MPWTKVDDQLYSHPKIQRAWIKCPVSLGLHLLALSHAGRWLTDGHVSETFVQGAIPGKSGREKAVAALVDAGLWDPVEGGWTIHGYLDVNPSREEWLAERAERVEKGRRGGIASGLARKRKLNQTRSRAEAAAQANGKQTRTPTPNPFP